MQKKRFFYLSIGLIIMVVAVGLTARTTFFKKAVKPEVLAPPVVEVEAPVIVEEPVEIEEEASGIIEEKVEVTVEVPEIEVPVIEEEKILRPEFQKGMSLVAWTENGYSNVNAVKAMEQLTPLGVEWVGLVSTWYQERYDSTDIYPLKDKSPSDESLIFAIRQLRQLNFKVMLKPHLDLIKSEGKWRGEIGFDLSSDWQAWFESYTVFLLHYAKIATEENVELFCVGTELTQPALAEPRRWRDLIKKVREVYKGQLTYAANWHNGYNQIEFWDALDYAGLDAYFPLVCSMQPTVEELKSVWQDWMGEIEAWQKKIDKPVLFTEMGYKSSRDAADEPWQHIPVGELDLELQVNCYRALLETFWDRPWFYGAYWWYWGVHPKMGGPSNRSFTPQNKPAQETIKEWYNKPISGKSY